MNHLELKEMMVSFCLRLQAQGLVIGTWGNVSVRVDGGLIVTPSKVPYEKMRPRDMVTLSLGGGILEGDRLPTSEADIHRALYNLRDDIGAAIHTHSPYATAVACLHRSIPPFVEDLAQIVGGPVNCTPYVPGGQHEEIAEATVRTIGDSDAVLLANHGPVCCGRDLEECFVTCQVVEKAARMMLAAASCGTMKEIPKEAVKSERHRFLYTYGTKADHL
jgi:L-fuculose-phosphate aldolase